MTDALTMPLTLLCGMAAACGLMPADARRRSADDGCATADVARLVTVAAVSLVVSFLAKLEFVNFDTASTEIEAPIQLLLMATFVLAVPGVRPMAAFYIAAWSQILAEMGFECVDLVTNGLVEPLRVICGIALSVSGALALYAMCRGWLAPQLQSGGAYLVSRRKLVFVVAIVVLFLLLR